LVLQNHRIDTVSALHAAEGLDTVFARAFQVVVPLIHEQARATSAGFRVELYARVKGPHSLATSDFCHRFVTHGFS
jgi:hypothetical protein